MGTHTNKSERPNPNIIEALMGKEKSRSRSSPATPHRRRKKQPSLNDSKQRSIKTMWTQNQGREEENESNGNMKSINNRSFKPRMTAVEKGDGSLEENSSK